MELIPRSLRKYLAVGTGVGIQIGGEDLHVVVTRVRPAGARVLGAATLARFRERPAAEWGAEYAAFVRRAGGSHLAAAVLLPRREVIVRQLALAGVPDRHLEGAIRLQVDSLHPYPEEEVVFAWARLPRTPNVLVAICQAAVIERYALLMAEAGIRVASFTFPAAACFSSIRLLGASPKNFLALHAGSDGVEAYGESAARPLYSALLDDPTPRAVSMAAADLRLPAEQEAVGLSQVLPAARSAPEGFDPVAGAHCYATSLVAACPRLALGGANLLPGEHRSASSRAIFVPTLALAAVLTIALAMLAGQGSFEDRRYLASLEDEIRRLQPRAARTADLDKAAGTISARLALLDSFRRRTPQDLDALQELTRILAPPLWLQGAQLSRTALTISGEAEQAATLLKLIDGSPLFRDSEFTMPMARVAGGETFTIKAAREAADGTSPAPGGPSK